MFQISNFTDRPINCVLISLGPILSVRCSLDGSGSIEFLYLALVIDWLALLLELFVSGLFHCVFIDNQLSIDLYCC